MKALIRHFGVARTGSRCLSSALWDVLGDAFSTVANKRQFTVRVSPHWFRFSDPEERKQTFHH